MLCTILFRLVVVLLVLLVWDTADSSAESDVLTPTLQWVRQFEASVGPAFEEVVDISAHDGLYIVGYTDGLLAGQPHTAAPGQLDAYIRKYDLNGNEVWTRQFGTPSAVDQAFGVAAHASGIYVVGTVITYLPGESPQTFLHKFDSQGNVVWTRQFGTAEGTFAGGVTVDGGAVYVIGTTGGSLPGQSGLGESDAYVRKYDLDGNEIWTQQFGTLSSDGADAIAGDGSSLYVVGNTRGSFAGQNNAGFGDVFVRKIDSNGSEIWTQQFGSANPDQPNSVAVNGGGVYIVGEVEAALPGQNHVGGVDSFIRVYSTNGNELWTRQFGTAYRDFAAGIALSDSGAHIVGSAFYEFDPSFNNTDVYIYTFDTNGTEVWTKRFGTDNYEGGRDIITLGTDLYVVGNSTLGLSGQPDVNNAGVFMRKYATDGTEQWTQQFGATTKTQNKATAHKAAVYDAVYIVGSASAAFPGQPYFGGTDAFIRKLDLDGNEAWTRQFGTTDSDVAIAVAADDSGIYVGYLSGQQGFARKYDSNGNEVWSRAAGRSVKDIALHSSGLFILGLLDTEPFGHYLRKLDRDGNEVWNIQIAVGEEIRMMAHDDSGIYLLGSGNGNRLLRKYTLEGVESWTRTLTFQDCPYDNLAVGPTGIFLHAPDRCFRRYDQDGNVVWTRTLALPQSFSGHKVIVDSTHLYITSLDTSAYLDQYDLDGNQIWSAQLGVSKTVVVTSITERDAHVYVLGETATDQTRPFLAKITKEAIDYTEFLYLPVVDGN
ncbi:hypothetical protein GC175_08895 [bacterium]|nr:hypothetical protein [bacterium]